jgi:carbon monoxide dehydrogenase subunit G
VIELEDTVPIDRPPADVFAHLADPTAYGAWLPGVRSVKVEGDGPIAAGTKLAVELDGPSGPIAAAGSITDYVPNERIALAADARQVRFAARFDLARAGAGTDLGLAVRVELKGLLRFAEGMVAAQAGPELGAALARLRAQVETGE